MTEEFVHVVPVHRAKPDYRISIHIVKEGAKIYIGIEFADEASLLAALDTLYNCKMNKWQNPQTILKGKGNMRYYIDTENIVAFFNHNE